MATFSYTALRSNGDRETGVAEAGSRRELIDRLQRQQRYPVRIREGSRRIKVRFPRLGTSQGLLTVTSELRILIGAGMTVDQALAAVSERCSDPMLLEALLRVRDAVRGGSALADALVREPKTFSPIYVALVRAGEASAHLPDTLTRLHGFLARRDAIEHRVASALIYPAILLCVAAAALWLLSSFVLPQFIPLFAEAGQKLPLLTRLALAVSAVFERGGIGLLVAIVVAVWIGRRLLRKPGNKLRLHGWLLRLPLFGSLWRNLEAARFARTAGTLVQAQANLPAAISLSIDVLTNAALQAGARRALVWLREGVALSEAMQRAGVLPPLSVRLLAVGEATGNMGLVLMEQADLLDQAAERQIGLLLALLVPGLTIGVGLLVGSILAAVMLAVLQLNSFAG